MGARLTIPNYRYLAGPGSKRCLLQPKRMWREPLRVTEMLRKRVLVLASLLDGVEVSVAVDGNFGDWRGGCWFRKARAMLGWIERDLLYTEERCAAVKGVSMSAMQRRGASLHSGQDGCSSKSKVGRQAHHVATTYPRARFPWAFIRYSLLSFPTVGHFSRRRLFFLFTALPGSPWFDFPFRHCAIVLRIPWDALGTRRRSSMCMSLQGHPP